MTTHPWMMYEIARMRDEERLLRARAAMRALELREDRPAEPTLDSAHQRVAWHERLRRSRTVREQARPHPVRPLRRAGT